MSEEAQEARNKDIRSYREHHARKFSRAATNEDVFRRLLLSSDPVISSIRQLPRKISSSFSREVLDLLKTPLSHSECPLSENPDSDSSEGSDTDSSE